MSFTKSIKNSIDLKGNKLFLFLAIISIFLALSAFFRFLQFNQTGYLGKVLIFIPLYLFFIFSLLEFCPHSIIHFIGKKANFAITIGVIITVTVVFYLLPYQFAPFRTQHTLSISVPDTSMSVRIQKMIDSEGNPVGAADPTNPLITESRVIQPGESFSYSRIMTGGLTILVSASHFPASVVVNWDGLINRYDISLDTAETKITTDASSWGMPTFPHAVLALMNLLSDWISCIFLCIFIIRLGNDWFKNHGLKFDEQHFINRAFLLTQLILIGVASVVTNVSRFPSYLIFIIMGFSLFQWALLYILGDSKKSIPLVDYFSQLFPKKNFPIYFFIAFSILAILGNSIFFPNHDFFAEVAIKRIGTTLTNLLFEYSGNPELVLSIDFYKQLDQSNIIISEGIVKKLALDTNSFSTLNHLKSIKIQKYNDYLSKDKVEALISDGRLITFENARRKIGYYHLLEISSNASHTYVFFQFDGDLFLLPENFGIVSLP